MALGRVLFGVGEAAARNLCKRFGVDPKERARAMTLADVIVAAVIFCCAVFSAWWLFSKRQDRFGRGGAPTSCAVPS